MDNLSQILLEASTEGMVLLEQGQIIACNSAALLGLGQPTKEAVLGQSFRSLVAPDSWHEALEVAEQGQVISFEWQESRPPHGVFFAQVTLRPLTMAGRFLLHVSWQDMTAAKQTEQVWRGQITQLEKDVEAVTLNNRLLFQQARQRARQLEQLARVEGILSQAHNETELVQALAFSFETNYPFIIRLSYFETAITESVLTLWGAASWRAGGIWTDDPQLGQHYSVAKTFLVQLVMSQPHTVVLIDNILTDTRLVEHEQAALVELGAKALAIIPLYSSEQWQGVIIFAWSEVREFTADERFILRRLLEPTSAVVASRRAYLAMEEAHQQNAKLLARTEIALKESQRLATIAKNHTDFIGVSDLEGNVLYINPAGLRMSGMTVDDITTMTVIDFYPPQEAKKFIAEIVPKALTAGYWLSETRMLRADGSIIPVDQTITANYDDQGEPYSFNITLRDISTRKKSQEQLQANANFLQTLFDTITSPIFYKDTKGVYLGCNKAFATYLGFSEAEIIGKTNHDFTPPDFAAENQHLDELLLREKTAQVYESRLVDAKGQSLDMIFNKNIFFDAEGQVAGLVGVIIDITARKQTEEQIKQASRQNNLLAAAINNAEIGVTISDPYLPDNPLVFINPAFENITGYHMDEVMGKNCRFLQGPETNLETVNEMRAAIKAQRSCTVELLNYRKNGSPFWNRLIINPIFDVEGKLINFIGVQTDVTHLKEGEAIQRRLSAIVEITTDFVGITDLEGRVLYINPAGRAMIGLGLDEDITRFHISHFHPQWTLDLLMNEAFPKASLGEVWAKEAALLTQEGQEIPISQVLVAQMSDDNQVEFFATIGRDITNIKTAEQEQKRLLAELEATYRQYVRHEWQQFLAEHQVVQQVSYSHPQRPVTPLQMSLAAIQTEVTHEGKTKIMATQQTDTHGQAVVAPISLRGQVIGTVSLQDEATEREWTTNEVALIEAVSEQLALTLENLRLFEETQQRAAREQLIAEMIQQVWASGELELVMQTTVEQLGKKLNASKVVIQLGTEHELLGY